LVPSCARFDALNPITQSLDGLGAMLYSYAVLGNGQRTFTEDGPWASDEVTVTNRYGLRAGLRIAQPSGGLPRGPRFLTSPGRAGLRRGRNAGAGTAAPYRRSAEFSPGECPKGRSELGPR
jgi:hypothetical protein